MSISEPINIKMDVLVRVIVKTCLTYVWCNS